MPDINVNENITIKELITTRHPSVFFRYDPAGHYFSMWVEGVEMARFKPNGDIDLHGNKIPSAF